MVAAPPTPLDESPPVARALLAPFAAIGEIILFWLQAFLGLMTFFGDLLILTGRTFGFILRGQIRLPHVLNQLSFLGVDSLAIVLLCVSFTGLTLSKVLMEQVEQVGAGKDLIGGLMLWAMSKELAPVLAGLIIAGRAGAGIASEISTMKVTEQIDALRATGVHPIRYLAVPRVVANLIAVPLLTFTACVVGVISGYISAHFLSVQKVSFTLYFDSVKQFWEWQLIQSLLYKSLAFGLIVATVAITEGLNTTGGAAGVGRSTTRAVVNAMVLIFLADMILTVVVGV